VTINHTIDFSILLPPFLPLTKWWLTPFLSFLFVEFKKLMRKHFGEEHVDQMTEGELYEKAIKLIRFVEIVERPEQQKEV
jgi:hypothetical protein